MFHCDTNFMRMAMHVKYRQCYLLIFAFVERILQNYDTPTDVSGFVCCNCSHLRPFAPHIHDLCQHVVCSICSMQRREAFEVQLDFVQGQARANPE